MGRHGGGAGTPPDPRFSFANERTFLAWNRTALALVATGLAITQLIRLGTRNVPVSLGVALIVLGAIVGLTGFGRWRSAEVALRLRAPLPRSRLAPSVLGLGLGVAAVASVVVLAGAGGR
jgi:putative membrane protein